MKLCNLKKNLMRVVGNVYKRFESLLKNLEKEMSALAENTVLYRAAVQLINKKLAAMRYAVTEGAR